MNDDAAFLAAIQAAPNDNALRLVYADWLEERGLPGAEFLRVECKVMALGLRDIPNKEEAVNSPSPGLLDSHYWQRTYLVADLRGTSLGLEETWMSAVSRVPVEEITIRVREIQSWLCRRIAVSEMPAGVLKLDEVPPAPKSFWNRIREFLSRSSVDTPSPAKRGADDSILKWAKDKIRPGDELWLYDSGGDSWEHLCGEMGYAIVRAGKVVEFDMVMMN